MNLFISYFESNSMNMEDFCIICSQLRGDHSNCIALTKKKEVYHTNVLDHLW